MDIVSYDGEPAFLDVGTVKRVTSVKLSSDDKENR